MTLFPRRLLLLCAMQIPLLVCAGLFGKRRSVADPTPNTWADRARKKSLALRDEASQALHDQRQAVEDEARRLQKEVEFLARQKGLGVKEALLDHAMRRQAELTTEVQYLTQRAEQLVEDRASRAETKARAELTRLEAQAVREGRKLAHVAESLAKEKLDQAENAAYQRLETLEQAAANKISSFYDYLLNGDSKSRKKTKLESFQNSLHLMYKRALPPQALLSALKAASLLHGLVLCISGSYFERQISGGGASYLRLPGLVSGSSLFQGIVDSMGSERFVASAVALVAAGILMLTNSSTLLRVSALLLALSWRCHTLETVLLVGTASLFLLVGNGSTVD